MQLKQYLEIQSLKNTYKQKNPTIKINDLAIQIKKLILMDYKLKFPLTSK